MQKLIEVVKLDGVPVTVEDAANYLCITPSSVVYRVINYTKSTYQGHVLERCEIDEQKASKLTKNNQSDEAVLQEKSDQKEKEGEKMTIRECLKKKTNSFINFVKKTNENDNSNAIKTTNVNNKRGRIVIRVQDGKEFSSAKEVSMIAKQAYPTVIAHLNGKDKCYVDPKTLETYVYKENFTGIKPVLADDKYMREHHIIKCVETGDILIGLTKAYLHSGGKIENGNNRGTHLMLYALKTKGIYEGKNHKHYVKLKPNDSKTFCALHSLPEKYDDRTIMSLEDKKVYKDARTVCKKYNIHEATFGYHLNKHGKFVLSSKKLTFVNIRKYVNALLKDDSAVIEISKKTSNNTSSDIKRNINSSVIEFKKETNESSIDRKTDMKKECLKTLKEGLDKISEAISIYLEMEKIN